MRMTSWRRERRGRPSTIGRDEVVVRHGRGRGSRVGMIMLIGLTCCGVLMMLIDTLEVEE